MSSSVLAHFPTRRSAEAAYDELIQRGIPREDVSVVGHGRAGGAGLREDDDHVGAGEGAAVGGIAGLLLGAAAMLIPGIGPVVAVGPLAAALAGAVTGGAAGAVVGGVTGALIDAGVDEQTARYYDERLRQGGVLLSVRADATALDTVRTVLERHGGDVERVGGVGSTA